MKRRATLAAALLAVVLFPAAAHARYIDLRLGLNAGGMYGWGTTPNTQDMFNRAAGPGFGAEIGLKLLVFDVSVNVLQIVKSGGLSATLIQGMLGTDIDVPVARAKLPSGHHMHIMHFGLEGGFVLGTNAPAMVPVTNDQLADKGISSRFRVGYEFLLNDFMGVGPSVDVGYHYLLGGQMVAANNTADHSSGYHLIGVASFIFHLGY